MSMSSELKSSLGFCKLSVNLVYQYKGNDC